MNLDSFLKALYKDLDGFLNIRSMLDISGGNKKVDEIFIPLNELDKAPWKSLGQKNKNGWNLYFGVCPRAFKKGNESSIKQVRCLWADVDSKDWGGSKEAALKSIEKMLLKPSIIIDSGNGYHCYWLLDKVFAISSPEDRDRIRNYNARIASTIKGDSVMDLSRILRLPDSWNMKDTQNPKRCKILKFDPEMLFPLENFELLPQIDKSKKNRREQKNTRDDLKWINSAIWGSKEGDRNKSLTRLAGYFLKHNHPEDVIESILGIVNARCTPPLPLEEVSNIVKSVTRYQKPDPCRLFTAVKIIKTEPPYYILTTDSNVDINFSLEELTGFSSFRKKYFAYMQRFPEGITPKNWDRFLESLMTISTTEEAPESASDDWIYYSKVMEKLESEEYTNDAMEFAIGRVYKKDGYIFFLIGPVVDYLRSLGLNIANQKLYSVLRKYGAQGSVKRIGDKTFRVWGIPEVTPVTPITEECNSGNPQ